VWEITTSGANNGYGNCQRISLRGKKMPFKSKAQQKFMHVKHPKIAKRWDDETPNMKELPKRAKKKSKK